MPTTNAIGVTLEAVPTECGITGGQIQSYSSKPYTPQIADLPDEYGNSVEQAKHGSGSIIEHTAVVALDCSATVNAIQIGVAIAGESNGAVGSVSIATSNADWPQATVVWYTGLPTCQSGTTFSAAVTVKGARLAQALGLTATGRVQNSTWAASATLSLLNNKVGEPAAYAFGGGTITASINAIGGTITAPEGWLLTDGPTVGETNTAFPTVAASGKSVLAGTPVAPAA